MKATGIVRRIDPLGRVVLPKELRRSLMLEEGDPMEIFTEEDRIILHRYSCADGLGDALDRIGRAVYEDHPKNEKQLMAKLAELRALLGGEE